jgi:hypothetical protein
MNLSVANRNGWGYGGRDPWADYGGFGFKDTQKDRVATKSKPWPERDASYCSSSLARHVLNIKSR